MRLCTIQTRKTPDICFFVFEVSSQEISTQSPGAKTSRDLQVLQPWQPSGHLDGSSSLGLCEGHRRRISDAFPTSTWLDIEWNMYVQCMLIYVCIYIYMQKLAICLLVYPFVYSIYLSRNLTDQLGHIPSGVASQPGSRGGFNKHGDQIAKER